MDIFAELRAKGLIHKAINHYIDVKMCTDEHASRAVKYYFAHGEWSKGDDPTQPSGFVQPKWNLSPEDAYRSLPPPIKTNELIPSANLQP